MTALVEAAGLSKHFPVGGGLFGAARVVRAVQEVTLAIAKGEVLGLVGESGSGKSTLGRALLRLIEPTAGSIRFGGADVTLTRGEALRKLRRRAQIVFQDPYASLDPRKRVEDIIGAGLDIHGLASGRERQERIAGLVREVGLSPDHLDRFPHQFSGGQRQRIGIARALAVAPDFLVADEPVSALDVSVQAQIVNLLADLQARRGLAMLFISHDLSVVQHLSDRIAVMYLGRIVELAPAEALAARPRHPYTIALFSAAPVARRGAKRRRIVLAGDLPSPSAPPSGCVFRTRCPHALPACAEAVPPLRAVGANHVTACIRDDIPVG
jgi:oligopeptide/dipeptide ABC transporter ATP-binding protein